MVDGRPMADGGLADAIPVKEAIRRGARRIMVLRSRSYQYVKRENIIEKLILRWFLRQFPLLRATLNGRARKYNETISLIRRPPAGISVFEICPPKNFRPARLSRNPDALFEGYKQGRDLAGKAIRLWNTA